MSVVIRIEDIWKQYRLGVLGHGALYRDVQSWWPRARGKPDPNSRVGLANHHDPNVQGDKVWALRGVSLDIRQGEVLGIIGRNGAGKSTLLKILSRVTAPTRGQVKIKGRIASLLEVGIGFHPELTGRENVYLNGAILGMRKAEIRSKFDEILDFAGIEQYIDTPVKRYSSGMYVRLAFAVAAHLEPEILVVDEVLAVGDAQFQQKCLGKMSEVSKAGRTVLLVSHNLDSVASLCSRAILIQVGEVIASGKTGPIIQHYLDGELKEDRKDGEGVKHGGPFVLKRCYLVNQEEDTIGYVRSSNPLNLVFEYQCRPEIRSAEVLINLVFGNSRIPTLLACPKEFSNGEIGTLPLNGRLIFTMSRLPLIPGVYQMRCAVLVNGHRSDKLWRQIRVLGQDNSENQSEQQQLGRSELYWQAQGPYVAEFRWSANGEI